LTPASRDIYIAQSSGIEKAAVRQAGSPLILPVPGLPRVRTFTNFFDHAGNLWFSNVNGLNKYDGQQVITYGEQSHPLFASRITDITETPQHQLVLATYGNGLLFFKDGRILKQVTKKDGLPENICKKLFIQDDVLWVATNKGLGKLLLSEKKFFSRPVSYTVSDGLVSNEVNDVFADGKNVYIATAKGLNIIPNRPLVQQTSPPVIQFTGVYTDNRAIDLRQAAELAPEQNRLLFKFIAITFQDPANVMYQYRLHQENYWVNTQNNSVELSALGPGRHTFQVRAKKLNSAWGAPITYQFYIQPPFWRSWWFLGLLAFGGLLTVVVSVRLYIVIKLRQQMRRLETEYRVQQERERIARDLHDNVGSHLAYIINSLEETPGQAGTTVAANAQDLREYTKQTIAQLRETIWAIRQEAISVRELGAKIQKLIWQISSHRPDFEYEVVIQGNQEAELTPAQALNLFRIAQEAVNNVFKHSHSTCVWVTLTVKQQAHLEMRIEDRGQGFERDSQGPEDHYGLVNMQERAKELGAYFKIYSVPAQGTQVYIKVGLE
jgi:signal transduction histidine kinase